MLRGKVRRITRPYHVVDKTLWNKIALVGFLLRLKWSTSDSHRDSNMLSTDPFSPLFDNFSSYD
ncbi:hypothetical protein E2542_SST17830 [Spatholobus suberectus]|nr:hypothetical protein E2542_SST17830 [Spatholobus suberectus]